MANPNFFLEILKAVCLRFDWVPRLFQISFQTVKPKLVQRCETKVDTAACKASYIGLLKKSALKNDFLPREVLELKMPSRRT